jgi:hypothetical protein
VISKFKEGKYQRDDIYKAVVMRSSAFWDIMLCFSLVLFLSYSSTAKMEGTWFSEMVDDSQQTARRYIPEDRNVQHGGQAK